MALRVEVRTTISATPHFFRHVRILAAALQRVLQDISYELVVSVGGGAESQIIDTADAWWKEYRIRWRWVPPERYASNGYTATSEDRVSYSSEADIIVIADSDLLPVSSWSSLIETLTETPAIAGVMAHAPPRLADNKPVDFTMWNILAQSFGIENLPFEYELSGWNIMFGNPDWRYAPAYFNGGFIVGNRALMLNMFALFPAAQHAVDRVMQTYFKPQIARTLSIYKADIPIKVLPLRYNFPNDTRFDVAFSQELDQVVNLHFLRKGIIDKHADFASKEALGRLIARQDLSGSNEVFRQQLQRIAFSQDLEV